MKKAAFLCVHNSCRSQIAEALAREFASEQWEFYSAGTELRDTINPDAVRLLKTHYDIDIEQTQYPKHIYDIPPVDLVITMGCQVVCPVLPYTYESEDWGLEDPTGQSDEVFLRVIREIETKVKDRFLRS